ncbi:MAG: crossover junction endodeoxyribonuclease RuvC [Clostridiales Family XIII bacterium]|jgi:crossover junction endodeoxyribonuclease RuvC|nr:crossover junction endodeoxyribonuclease RuvC [Clostridiales Family XIII bacterium]
MKILGIAPGYARLGYGFIEARGGKFSLMEYGTVDTASGMAMPERLKLLYSRLMELIYEFGPDVAAIEELFFNNNAKTALLVGQARGAAILACVNSGIGIYEYTPLQIKQGLTGYGRADKNQMQLMVKTLLGIKETPKPDDAADALAAAICHANSANCLGRIDAALRAGGMPQRRG